MKVTKFKSMNLLGETRREEEKRLRDERIKLAIKGAPASHRKEVRRGGSLYLKGTTAFQRKRRRKLLGY